MSFTGLDNGVEPNAPLLADTTGSSGAARALYGTAGYVFKLSPSGVGEGDWTEKLLWKPSEKAGFEPGWGGLIASSKRITNNTSVFGATTYGGRANPACVEVYDNTCGTVFSIVGHHHTKIYSFTGNGDGGEPFVGPVADKAGNLYVATMYAGGPSGCGTVVKLTPPAVGQKTWTEETLWAFSGGNDGCNANAVIVDKSGVLYGTAYGGGSANCGGGCGSVFMLTPPVSGQSNWTETTLWDFQGGSDGAYPFPQLTLGDGGALYGTASGGGNAGVGVVFSLTPPGKGKSAWTEQVIWPFTGGSDGGYPYSVLIFDKAGSLYGTASGGGNSTGNGTVFRLSPPTAGGTSWSETTLWQFSGNDGAIPQAGLTSDKAGGLYGTTTYGGSVGYGTVFSLQGTGFSP